MLRSWNFRAQFYQINGVLLSPNVDCYEIYKDMGIYYREAVYGTTYGRQVKTQVLWLVN